MCLKKPLRSSIKSSKDSTSWRLIGFTSNGSEETFGAGKLSLSVGNFQQGHSVYIPQSAVKNPY